MCGAYVLFALKAALLGPVRIKQDYNSLICKAGIQLLKQVTYHMWIPKLLYRIAIGIAIWAYPQITGQILLISGCGSRHNNVFRGVAPHTIMCLVGVAPHSD